MPIYEYQCQDCNNHIEVIQKFSDNPLTTCERCSGQLQKVLSQSSFVLKGSGWYITDYARKAKAETNAEAKATESTACQPTAEGGCAAPACAANTTPATTATATSNN
jgi:putative FmdB family regulatory protein